MLEVIWKPNGPDIGGGTLGPLSVLWLPPWLDAAADPVQGERRGNLAARDSQPPLRESRQKARAKPIAAAAGGGTGRRASLPARRPGEGEGPDVCPPLWCVERGCGNTLLMCAGGRSETPSGVAAAPWVKA